MVRPHRARREGGHEFAADGSWPKATATCNTTVTPLLDQIVWWARALRDARTARPYPA